MSDTAPPKGIDAAAVTDWLTERVPGVVPPLAFSLIAGGHSNLTYSVTDAADGHWVLRRPPLGHVLATAHDMGREHKIIAALQGTDVPVPPVIGLSPDDSVNGAPFYVMGYVDGTVVRDMATAEALSIEQRRRASDSLIEVMAAIHGIDVAAVGLDDLGRHDGYIERQLKRWYRQYQGSQEQNPSIDFHQVDEVYEHLSARIPQQQSTSIVHGDYRLDNCMIGPDGDIVAVLDWEICTLGDPLADVGLLWVYWTDPGTTAALPQSSPTSLEGFRTKDEMVAAYAAASGRDVSDIDFYIAFGYWKLTCIIAGVYARYAAGAMGDTTDQQVSGFAHMVVTLAELAAEAARKVV
ncbi:MAG: phosphotransferase family protein [Acidimicrobiales bacterium]